MGYQGVTYRLNIEVLEGKGLNKEKEIFDLQEETKDFVRNSVEISYRVRRHELEPGTDTLYRYIVLTYIWGIPI